MRTIKVLDTFAIPIDKYNILRALGKVNVFPNIATDKAIILQRSANANVIVVNKTKLSAEIVSSFEQVDLIIETATGYDNIDVTAATKCGIAVCNAPAYSTNSVAEHVFTLILGLSRKLKLCSQQTAQGKWCAEPLLGTELAGKTIGVVGFGKIGQAVAKIAQGFSMQIVAYTQHPAKYKKEFPHIEFVNIQELMQRSNIVSLHIPHTPQTNKFICADILNLMQPGAILINTARGKIIDEPALINVAKQQRINIGLDVLATEGIAADNELNQLPNVLITPHVGWYTNEAIDRLMQIVYDNIYSFYQGKPINIVN